LKRPHTEALAAMSHHKFNPEHLALTRR